MMTLSPSFNQLGLSDDMLRVVQAKSFHYPSPIQAKIIPLILKSDQDIIGIAKTGSGKTASFGLPIIDAFAPKQGKRLPSILVITPTRELAKQVSTELQSLQGNKKLSIVTLYGGVSIQQNIRVLADKKTDIIVGTPGRLCDLIRREALQLTAISYIVIDEADEMLRMGFIEDINAILACTPEQKRIFLFSATMPTPIKRLAKKYMKKQQVIELKNQADTQANITQQFAIVPKRNRTHAVCRIIAGSQNFYGIIFCMTRLETNHLAQELHAVGHTVACLHGDIPQAKREQVLQDFRQRNINILVATDVAARGIDVPSITHVVNHSLPQDTATYIHRIGRTGRANKSGIAISLISRTQQAKLKQIQKTTKITILPTKLPTEQDMAAVQYSMLQQEIIDIIAKKKHLVFQEMSHKLIDDHDTPSVVAALLYKRLAIKSPPANKPANKQKKHTRKKKRHH